MTTYTEQQIRSLRKASAVLCGAGHPDEAADINALLAAPTAAVDDETTVYDPAFVRQKFQDYQRQIDGLNEELAHVRASAPQAGEQAGLTDADRDALREAIEILVATGNDRKAARIRRILLASPSTATPPLSNSAGVDERKAVIEECIAICDDVAMNVDPDAGRGAMACAEDIRKLLAIERDMGETK